MAIVVNWLTDYQFYIYNHCINSKFGTLLLYIVTPSYSIYCMLVIDQTMQLYQSYVHLYA